MDVQASASGEAAAWTSPTYVDFGYVAFGNCAYESFTVTVPEGTPSGDYGLTWTYTCQLEGGGTCTGDTEDFDVQVSGEISSTTTTVSCSPDSITTSGYATCDISVSGSQANPPTGDVTLDTSSSTGSFSSSQCDISTGTCSVSYSDPTPGTYTVTANYPGDDNNEGSSASTTITVAAATTSTTTTVSCTPNPMSTADTATCTASVSGSSDNPPTGSVDFSSDSLGSFSQDSCDITSGSCSISYSNTSPGIYGITASYPGDTYNDPSTGTTSLTVTAPSQTAATPTTIEVVTEAASTSIRQAQTTTSVSCSPGTVASGTSTTCTVDVSGNGPTGLADFYTTSTDGAFDPESCSLSGGSCSVQYVDGQGGQPTITAEYGGDDGNLGSQGTTVITVTGGKQEQSCDGFYLTEGLAPAAPTTGDDNITSLSIGEERYPPAG